MTLNCGVEEFARLRSMVLSDVGTVPSNDPDAIRRISIVCAPIPVQWGLRHYAMMTGCSLAMLAIVFVFVVGVTGIARWLR